MKEKRYFCDKVEFWGKKEGALIFAIILICTCFIFCGIIIHNYRYLFESYSPEAYEELELIANNVITEGVGIDLSKMPENISTYRINYENNEITFEYWLDEQVSEYEPAKYMEIKLSSNYNILSKSSPYSSEEVYINRVSSIMVAEIISYSLLLSFAIFGFGFICFCVAVRISKNNKYYYELAKH